MGQFALQLAEFAKKAGGNADLVVKKVAIDLLARVVMRSPVDTGRFRSNWAVTIGARPPRQRNGARINRATADRRSSTWPTE